jgi:HK97 family phage prohead protease
VGIQRQTETKAIGFQGVGFDDVEGTLEGFAAVYGNWDRANEVIEPGACAKTISERKAKVPMGLDHLHGFGVTEDLQEVGRADLPASIRSEYPDATGGLYCKGRVVLSDENVRRLDLIRQRSAAGQPVGMSITYRVMRETPGQTPTGAKSRRLQELALHE